MTIKEILHKEIYAEAKNHILPFWNTFVDHEDGGFIGFMSTDLQVNQSSDKGGIATARHLWSWAAAYRAFGDQMCLDNAKIAYDFLCDKVLDKDHEGIYWMVDKTGEVTDSRKHVYAQAFLVYGLSEYNMVTNDQEALERAKSIFHLIETKGYDSVHGLYKEEFDRYWNETSNEMLSENGVMAEATTNTHLHVLEAYTNLYRVWPDQKVYNALKDLLDLFVGKLFKADTSFIKVFYNKETEELLDLQSYGHDIEASWLLKEAIDVLGLNDQAYIDVIIAIAENIYDKAINLDGSVTSECEASVESNNSCWWVQAEAMVGFYNAYEMTGQTKFLDVTSQIWAFTKEHMIDKRPGSEWFAYVDHNHKPVVEEPIVEPWKTPYHNIRFCIELIERTKSNDTSKILSASGEATTLIK